MPNSLTIHGLDTWITREPADEPCQCGRGAFYCTCDEPEAICRDCQRVESDCQCYDEYEHDDEGQ